MTHQEWDKIKEVPSNFEQYWIEIAENKLNTKNTISCIYGRIRMDTSVDTLDVKAKWELEANTMIADGEWESPWVSWQKCLSSPV